MGPSLHVVSSVLVVLIAFAGNPAYARRNRDSSADSPAMNSQIERRQKVPPTYIDTLNRGKEICLAKTDFSSIAQSTPEQEKSIDGKTAETDGFRIQCMASANIETVRACKKEMESRLKYPQYIVFTEPYYKLQLGDFATRQAAEAALVRVKEAGYSEAWIVHPPAAAQQSGGRRQ